MNTKKSQEDRMGEVIDRLEELNNFQDTFLTIDELAIYMHLSKSHLYRMSMLKKIPGAYRPTGKHLLFSKRRIDEWIRSNAVKTASEVEQEAVNYICNHKRK